jgi:phosphoenolpyruvate-protein kinase (PTS system EI component)
MNQIAQNLTISGAYPAARGYAVGPIKVFDLTEAILAASPDAVENPPTHEEATDKIVELAGKIAQEIEAPALEALSLSTPSETQYRLISEYLFAQDIKEKGWKTLDQFIRKMARTGHTFTGHETPYELLKEIYNFSIQEQNFDQMKGLSILLIEIMGKYAGIEHVDFNDVQKGDVVVVRDLTVKDVLKLMEKEIAGIITPEKRGNHTVIIAIENGIPCLAEYDLIKEHPQIANAPSETQVAIDTYRGTGFLNPSSDVIAHFRKTISLHDAYEETLAKESIKTCETLDGKKITIFANVNDLNFEKVRNSAAEGIGLLRLESLFNGDDEELGRITLRNKFNNACDQLGGSFTVCVRLLDVNGSDKKADKLLHQRQLKLARHVNEKFGLDFLLHNRGLLDSQIRALMEASTDYAGIEIMLPFVESPEQVKEVKSLMDEIYERIQDDDDAPIITRKPKLNIMVETEALSSDPKKLEEAIMLSDGASIGSNDLSHEMAGTNRYQTGECNFAYSKDFISRLNTIVELSKKHNKPVKLCGNLASDTTYLPILIALDVDLATLTGEINGIREAVRHLCYKKCKDLLRGIMENDQSPEEIKAELLAFCDSNIVTAWHPEEHTYIQEPT